MAENGNGSPEEDYKERVKEEKKEEIQREKAHEEALEEKEQLEEEAEYEAELEEAQREGMARSVVKKGAGVIGGAFSTLGSKVKGYAEKKAEGGGRQKVPETPPGKNLSDLTELQKRYFYETGTWPKVEGTMTRDYYQWKQRKKQTRRSTGGPQRQPGEAGVSMGGIFGGGRRDRDGGSRTGSIFGQSRRREPSRSPITMSRREKAKGSNLFGEKIDQTDNNPFKLSKGEKKPKNPFGS